MKPKKRKTSTSKQTAALIQAIEYLYEGQHKLILSRLDSLENRVEALANYLGIKFKRRTIRNKFWGRYDVIEAVLRKKLTAADIQKERFQG